MRPIRFGIAATMALALAGCGEEFKPASYVDKLRLLAIQAAAPEIAPLVRDAAGTPLDPQPEGAAPDRTTFTSLVADPLQFEDPEREAIVVYLACTPEPGSLEPSICSLLETYADPKQLPELMRETGGACGGAGGGSAPGELGQGVVGGISFVGIEACDHVEGCAPPFIDVGGTPVQLPSPTYVLPPDFRLDELPAGHPQRNTGLPILVVTLVVSATPQELLDGADPADFCAFADRVNANLVGLLESREQLIALKRVQVRGPDNEDPINVNPEIPGFTANGVELPDSAPVTVTEEAHFRAGQQVKLLPVLPRDENGQPLPADVIYQPFTRWTNTGEFFRDVREQWLWSWFTTAGEMETDRTKPADEEQTWTAPGTDPDYPVPAHRQAMLYSVVRDARGGIAWAKRLVEIH